MLKLALLVVAAACFLNVVINSGCVTKSAVGQSSFQLEDLNRAAGQYYDTPLAY